MKRASVAAAFALSFSAQADSADPWAAFAPLLGEWVGEGGGAPGQGQGGFTFERALQGAVVVRKNFAEYPEKKTRHEDLMVIHREEGTVRADYWDSEGHSIDYSVSASADAIVFTSEAGKGPRFRLTYTFPEKDKANIKFEIAPPGMPDRFKPYINATARRVK